MLLRLLARFLARPAVTDWLIRRAMRTPYTPIVKDGEIYMTRYWLFNPYPADSSGKGNRFPISIRLHHILLPDRDRHMHDHPWNARTFILRGWYREQRREPSVDRRVFGDEDARSWYNWDYLRGPGDTTPLSFGEYHRITELSPGGTWTLFVTGKYRGTWGFLVDGAST